MTAARAAQLREERRKLRRYFHTRTFSRLGSDFDPDAAPRSVDFARLTPFCTAVWAGATLGIGIYFIFF